MEGRWKENQLPTYVYKWKIGMDQSIYSEKEKKQGQRGNWVKKTYFHLYLSHTKDYIILSDFLFPNLSRPIGDVWYLESLLLNISERASPPPQHRPESYKLYRKSPFCEILLICAAVGLFTLDVRQKYTCQQELPCLTNVWLVSRRISQPSTIMRSIARFFLMFSVSLTSSCMILGERDT